jgi:type I restriction-modification system DNA methylase subunit
MPKSSARLRRIEEPDFEAAYAQVTDPSHRKQFGQFFTPRTVASLMADWVTGKPTIRALDPAMGTGVLVRALLDRGVTSKITGYELDSHIASHSGLLAHPNVRVIQSDFLRSKTERQFDAIVMNPPYIRHRELEGLDDVRAKLSTESGFIIPKSANLYIYFAVKAAMNLLPKGRAALLIPTEWMNANFSTNFKRFLLERKLLKELVIFSGCSNIFGDALTTASILFLENTNG